MIRRPPRSTRVRSSAASDVYKRQVRVSYQSITAHQMQIVEFLLHVLIFPRHMQAALAISCKELSYHLHVTLFLFIQVHFIAPAKAKNAKGRLMMIEPYLRQYIVLQVVVEWIVARQMPKILL